MSIKIAIDGPSGSGKSTLAKNIARELGLIYVDTGALYRSVGLYVKRCGIDPKQSLKVTQSLSGLHLELRYTKEGQRVIMNGEDVSDLIRTPEMSMYASAVSSISGVRMFLLEIQKKMAGEGNVVMDGRDIGTVIMPDADVKLFLEASAPARARRRHEELMQRGDDSTEQQVLEDILKRDKKDKNRDISPAIPADDAVFIDNSEMEPEQTLEAALRIIEGRVTRKLS